MYSYFHSPYAQFIFRKKTLTFPGWTLRSKSLDVRLQKEKNQIN